MDKVIDICEHVFINVNNGVCDACDAPFWLPYDEEKAKGWCPIIPEQYTKDLYENDIALKKFINFLNLKMRFIISIFENYYLNYLYMIHIFLLFFYAKFSLI